MNLNNAILNKNIPLVKKIIKTTDEYNRNKAFSIACMGGSIEIVKIFIENNIDIHYQDDAGFILAASEGNLDIMIYLDSYGIKQSSKNEAFIHAVQYDQLHVIKHLINEDVDVHYHNDQALIISASEGHLNIVKFLVNQGANIHTQNNRAIISAANEEKLEIIKYFIIDCNINPQILYDQNCNSDVLNWVNSYLKSKKLNQTLESNLSVDKINKTLNIKKKI